jgi:GrpB-like predicted nucleotidyltransferase (UPF0157 family)
MITVVPYHSDWPNMFTAEAQLIQQALGSNCIAIHHIGSTAVPGLSAKPVIDMIPVVKDIQEVDRATQAMQAIGYEAKGEYGIAFRRYFQKGGESRTHHAHVFQEGDCEISRHLKFREWMRTHADDAERYARLKKGLAAKFPNDRLSYCMGKDAFIANIDAKSGFDGWRMVQALTDREWSGVCHLRQQFFLQQGSFSAINKDHIHFVFYKNEKIIGYIDLEQRPPNEAIVHMLILDKDYSGFKSQFLKHCERWLQHQGISTLFVFASQDTYQFYCQHEYEPFSQNNPFEMAKSL